MIKEFETVIGLELHVHLKTATKAFCGCATQFGAAPNTQTCPVCLGFPGSLPVLNEKALDYAVKVALALKCSVQPFIKFDRKNYFYPDLPKNYQISQYDMPIGLGGSIEIDDGNAQRTIRIKRVHLEEDAGKLVHAEGQEYSLVDFNRCGIPLLEIVSEPDISSPQEAFEYLKNLKLLVQYTGASDCDMEKGSLRCDANISLRPKGQKTLGTKIELKNMNSFRGVRLALEYEQERQKKILEEGKAIQQETHLWDEAKGVTVPMRSKEEAHDYRYFPDPDLVPFTLEPPYIESIQKQLSELPRQKTQRFIKQFSFSRMEAEVIVQEKDVCEFFEQCLTLYAQPRTIYNWLTGPVLGYLNDRSKKLCELSLGPRDFIQVIRYVQDGTLSNLAAKDVLFGMLDSGNSADAIIAEKGLKQVSGEDDLAKFVEQVIKENEKTVLDYRQGKENAVMFLVGQAMKLLKGKGNPKVIKDMLIRRLRQ